MENGLQNAAGAVRRSQRCTRVRLDLVPPYFQPNNTNVQDAEYHAPLGYDFTINNVSYKGQMADEISVILLPGARYSPGTAPQPGELEPIMTYLSDNFNAYNWIKGHLWNQEVGGPGVTKNLVPLTSTANSAHKNWAEAPIKNALDNFASYYLYNQNVQVIYGFHYTVAVEDEYWAGSPAMPVVPGNVVPRSIYVQAIPIEYDPKATTWPPYQPNLDIITTAANRLLQPTLKRLAQGIWIDQAGNVTDAQPN